MSPLREPADGSKIKTTPQLEHLAELLARNARELWAGEQDSVPGRTSSAGDRAEPGATRPSWELLSAAERARAHEIALAALKTLLAAGYEVVESTSAPSDAKKIPVNPEVIRAQRILESPLTASSLSALLALWNGRDPGVWHSFPELSARIAEGFIKLGEPLVAYDVVAEALKQDGTDVRLRQVLALALARSGAGAQANRVLQSLYGEGHRDEETVGLLARTHKDLASEVAYPAGKEVHLTRAFVYYLEAYRLSGGYWTGINAATLALILGNEDQARALAREIDALCLAALKGEESVRDRYWVLATLGEAALIQGDLTGAEAWYRQAVETGRGRFGDLHTSRRNALLILGTLGRDASFVERCFVIPAVVVFTGHMIDRPDRGQPRFPARLERPVREAISERLRALNAGFGYASAACGSDILFLEALLELKGEAHVVLPFGAAEFIQESVALLPEGDWPSRFKRILEHAAEVVVASTQRLRGEGVSYDFANQMMYGLARIRSEQLETVFQALAVWDGRAGDGPGGTGATVEQWRGLGHRVEVIDLARMLRDLPPDSFRVNSFPVPVERARDSEEAPAGFTPEIRALLFADAVGFSQLSEDELPGFVHHFLGLVGELAARPDLAPVMKNTWGDGLFFVFADVLQAGLFALELVERILSTEWSGKGLRDMNLRVGLHAGPVYACIDPVTQRGNYIGMQVSRAARIEPITPPGQVYASQDFAALAAAQGVKEFRCAYVGRTGLAKNYGNFPTYVVHRRTD